MAFRVANLGVFTYGFSGSQPGGFHLWLFGLPTWGFSPMAFRVANLGAFRVANLGVFTYGFSGSQPGAYLRVRLRFNVFDNA